MSARPDPCGVPIADHEMFRREPLKEITFAREKTTRKEARLNSAIAADSRHPVSTRGRRIENLYTSSSNDLSRGNGFCRQGSYGIHRGDQSGDDSSVLCGTAGNVVGNLRRGDLRRWLYDLLHPHVSHLASDPT